MLTLADFLLQAQSQYDPEHRDPLGVELLIAHGLHKTREQLITDSKQLVDESQQIACHTLLQRFALGEPIAYLLQKKDFYDLTLYVDKRVLIPRPETEMLVDEVLNFIQSKNESAEKVWKIIDVGTGSGCIALALASQIPKTLLWATDVSADALEVAAHNIATYRFEQKIKLLQADLLEPLDNKSKQEVLFDPQGADIIVANLPYIGTEKYKFVSRDTYEYEPHKALFGGADGLQLYEKFFTQLREKSWKPSLIVGEFGFLQGDSMRILLEKFYPGQWEIQLDGAAIERMFIVKN